MYIGTVNDFIDRTLRYDAIVLFSLNHPRLSLVLIILVPAGSEKFNGEVSHLRSKFHGRYEISEFRNVAGGSLNALIGDLRRLLDGSIKSMQDLTECPLRVLINDEDRELFFEEFPHVLDRERREQEVQERRYIM